MEEIGSKPPASVSKPSLRPSGPDLGQIEAMRKVLNETLRSEYSRSSSQSTGDRAAKNPSSPPVFGPTSKTPDSSPATLSSPPSSSPFAAGLAGDWLPGLRDSAVAISYSDELRPKIEKSEKAESLRFDRSWKAPAIADDPGDRDGASGYGEGGGSEAADGIGKAGASQVDLAGGTDGFGFEWLGAGLGAEQAEKPIEAGSSGSDQIDDGEGHTSQEPSPDLDLAVPEPSSEFLEAEGARAIVHDEPSVPYSDNIPRLSDLHSFLGGTDQSTEKADLSEVVTGEVGAMEDRSDSSVKDMEREEPAVQENALESKNEARGKEDLLLKKPEGEESGVGEVHKPTSDPDEILSEVLGSESDELLGLSDDEAASDLIAGIFYHGAFKTISIVPESFVDGPLISLTPGRRSSEDSWIPSAAPPGASWRPAQHPSRLPPLPSLENLRAWVRAKSMAPPSIEEAGIDSPVVGEPENHDLEVSAPSGEAPVPTREPSARHAAVEGALESSAEHVDAEQLSSPDSVSDFWCWAAQLSAGHRSVFLQAFAQVSVESGWYVDLFGQTLMQLHRGIDTLIVPIPGRRIGKVHAKWFEVQGEIKDGWSYALLSPARLASDWPKELSLDKVPSKLIQKGLIRGR